MAREKAEARGVSFETVREVFLSLPGVEERSSYGTPGFYVKKKFLSRLREPDVLVVRISFESRDFLMDVEAEAFFTTAHYRDYPSVLVRLTAAREGMLRDVLVESWRFVAPPKMVAEWERETAALA